METLAYLHIAQENEDSEVKEITLDASKLSSKAAVGALGIAAAAVGAFATADQASAYGCGGYNYYPVYDGCGADYGYYPYQDYYSYDYGYDYYNYYPVYDSCGSYNYDPCSSYNNYYPYYDYGYNYYDSYYDYGYNYYDSYYPVSPGGCYEYNPCDSYYGYGGYGGYGGGYYGVAPDGPGARPGDVGYDVAAVQRALNANGFPVFVDGVAGPQTTSAIAAFQASRGILVDGVAGPQTLSFLGLY